MQQRLSDPQRRHARGLAETLFRITLAWVVLLGVYYLVPFDGMRGNDAVLRAVIGLVIVVLASAWEVYRTSQADMPGYRAIAALGVLIPLLVVVFAAIYLAMSHLRPHSFTESLDHTRALYFTTTTLATVGFGDITARSDPARLLVCVQILFDLLMIGGVVRLLSRAAGNRTARQAADQPPE